MSWEDYKVRLLIYVEVYFMLYAKTQVSDERKVK